MNSKPLVRPFCLVAFCITLTGCWGESKPRPLEEIRSDQLSLPAVYLSHPDHREVIAPSDKGDVIIDEASGELVFRAWTCVNPDCPGKKPTGERPLLFIWYDPLYYIDEDNTVNYNGVPNREEMILEKGGTLQPTCPECLKIRELENETPEMTQQYRDWCQQYDLPESAKRAEELAAEHQARIDYINRRIGNE